VVLVNECIFENITKNGNKWLITVEGGWKRARTVKESQKQSRIAVDGEKRMKAVRNDENW
jgi:hypothetical protein